MGRAFSDVMEEALYHPERGFYERVGGGAGRRGDFLTAPEVGPLFGAVLARALDGWWQEAGRPSRFIVFDCGAGPGTLGRALREAGSRWPYVAVDRSAAQRARHQGLASLADLPDRPVGGVVLANELLDNLPFDLELDGQPFDLDEEWPGRGLAPRQRQAQAWLERALRAIEIGRIVVLDYCSTTAEMAARPWSTWLRTYRRHGRGVHPLLELGGQDITAEVAVDQLVAVRPPDENRSQAEFLRAWGIDELVAQGRRTWAERAHLGDLEAVKARSRIVEAEALTDPAGMGAFRVLEWRQPGGS